MENNNENWLKFQIKKKEPFKVDRKDPNFDRPISDLTKIYKDPDQQDRAAIDRLYSHYQFEIIQVN